VRVNLGAGNRCMEGWVNVDQFNGAAERKEDIRLVNFDPGTVDEVLTSHVLEHIPRADTLALLAKIFAWLKPGGLFVCEMPNLTTCLQIATSKNFDKARNGLKGICGGRPVEKNGWDAWMFAHRLELITTASTERTVDHLVPPAWKTPGDSHLHVWHAEDFAEQCRTIGFATTLGPGTIHGFRYGRDFRCEARKP
jgi:SAM-dependent methyltransferase